MRYILPRLIVAVLAVAALAMPGCSSNGGGGTTVVTSLQATPLTLPFGIVRVGATSSLTITLNNISTSSIDVTAGTFTTGTVFSIAGGTFPLTLAASTNTTVTVDYNPTAVGNDTDTVTFTHTGLGGSPSVTVTGTGALPDILATSVAAVGTTFNTGDPLPVTREYSEAAGVDPAGTIDVQYILSTDQIADPGDTVLTSETAVTLTASQVVTGALGTTPTTPGVASGTYYVGMTVDSGATETEANEGNNTVFSTTTITITLTAIIISGTVTDSGSGAGIANARVYAGTDFDDTDVNGDYSITVLSAGPFDVECLAPGYIGQTVTAVTAPATQNFSLTAPLNILLFTDNGLNPANTPTTALTDIGLIGVTTTFFDNDDAGFQAALTGGTTWDLVIFNKQNFGGTGSMPAVDTWFNASPTSRLLFVSWQAGSAGSLLTTLGVSITSTTGTENIYRWDTTHPICNFPEQWPDATPPWPATGFGVNGFIISLNGGTAPAGSQPTTTAGAEKLVINNNGRSIFLAFLPEIAHTGSFGAPGTTIDYDTDGIGDANEMWRNFITYLLAH